MKMAPIRLTCHPEIMIAVMEQTVVSPMLIKIRQLEIRPI